MFNLDSIFSGSIDRPPRIIITGEEKVGKTTFATSAPNTILIQIKGEEGADGINCAKFPVIEELGDLRSALESLCGDGHEFETLVIDSISALEPLIHRHICQRDNKKNIEEFGYGKGYNLAEIEFQNIIEALDYLRNSKNMAIIIIGHSKITNFSDPAGDSYTKYELDCHKAIMATVQRWADCLLFAKFKTISKTVDGKFNTKEKKSIAAERVLYTQTTGAFPAGGRGVFGNLPAEIELDYNVFMNEINKLKGN